MMTKDGSFICIEVPKTASTSIRSFFKKRLDMRKLPTFEDYARRERMLGTGPVKNRQHAMAMEVRELLPDRTWLSEDVWEKAFKVATVRNPFDRAVSAWTYWRKECKCKGSFEQFLKGEGTACHAHIRALHLSPQSRYICDESGKYLVNKFVYFENIQQSLGEVCEFLGIPFGKVPHIYRTRKRGKHYSEYYTDELVEIVADMFAEDMPLGDYTFEDRR